MSETRDQVRNELSVPAADFVCPRDHGPLQPGLECFVCSTCGSSYPLVRGVPVFICDERSVFSVADYTRDPGAAVVARVGIAARCLRSFKVMERHLAGWLEATTSNVRRPFYPDAVAETLKRHGAARVLVVGSGSRSYRHPQATVVCTDVDSGRTFRRSPTLMICRFPTGASTSRWLSRCWNT